MGSKCKSWMSKSHRNYEFKTGNQRLFLMKNHLATKFNISSRLQPVCEVRVSRIWFFTGSLVFVIVMCKVKHFFPQSTQMELRLCVIQDPVVQSVVSLTISLRHKFVKQISAKVTNTLLFFVEKMWESFALQRILTFYQQKITVYL